MKQDDEDDSDDSELSDFDLDETTLETYLTPIDDEDCDNPIDEYIAFQQVITRKLKHRLKSMQTALNAIQNVRHAIF